MLMQRITDLTKEATIEIVAGFTTGNVLSFDLQVNGGSITTITYTVQASDGVVDVVTALRAEVESSFAELTTLDVADRDDLFTIQGDDDNLFVVDSTGQTYVGIDNFLPESFEWAIADSPTVRVKPDAEKQEDGWVPNEAPSRQIFNSLLNTCGVMSGYIRRAISGFRDKIENLQSLIEANTQDIDDNEYRLPIIQTSPYTQVFSNFTQSDVKAIIFRTTASSSVQRKFVTLFGYIECSNSDEYVGVNIIELNTPYFPKSEPITFYVSEFDGSQHRCVISQLDGNIRIYTNNPKANVPYSFSVTYESVL